MDWKPSIYYTAPMRHATGESLALAQRTLGILGRYGDVLTDEHQFDRKREGEATNIFEREVGRLNDADVVVADISAGSFGVGFLAGVNLALLAHPTLLMYDRSLGTSQMPYDLKHPLLQLKAYDGPDGIESCLDGFFAGIGQTHRLFPRYVQYDAIDGAGKSAITEVIKESVVERNIPAFDVVKYWAHANHIPTWGEVQEMVPGCSLIFVAEPSFAWGGKEIRDEIIRKGSPYTALETMLFFANQRSVLDKRLVIPALESGAWVIKDRGARTSDVYQPVQAMFEGYSEEFARALVRGLPGNQQAFNYAPGLFFTIQLPAHVAMARLQSRPKQDDAKFETLAFQERIADRYADDRLKRFWTRRGTQMVDVIVENERESRDVTMEKIRAIWLPYLGQS